MYSTENMLSKERSSFTFEESMLSKENSSFMFEWLFITIYEQMNRQINCLQALFNHFTNILLLCQASISGIYIASLQDNY